MHILMNSILQHDLQSMCTTIERESNNNDIRTHSHSLAWRKKDQNQNGEKADFLCKYKIVLFCA